MRPFCGGASREGQSLDGEYSICPVIEYSALSLPSHTLLISHAHPRCFYILRIFLRNSALILFVSRCGYGKEIVD